MSALPSAGPIFITVPGLTDVAITAQVGTVPTLSPVVRFKWPRPFVVAGFWLSLRAADPAGLAALGIRVLDNQANELFTDGFGTAENFFGLAGAMMGTGARTGLLASSGRWMPFRRIVRGGDKWTLQLQNRGAATVIPWLAFRLEMQNNG